MRFEYWHSIDGQWYWHLRARNGEIVAHSEGYTTKAKCIKAIIRVQQTAMQALVIGLEKAIAETVVRW